MFGGGYVENTFLKEPRFWITSMRQSNLIISQKYRILKIKSRAYNLIKPRDFIIVYLKDGGAFRVVFRVLTSWISYHPDNPPILYEEEILKDRILYPFYSKIDVVGVGWVEVTDLVNDLSFIERKYAWQTYLTGFPANFRRPIPKEDAKKILKRMKLKEEVMEYLKSL